MIRELKDKIAGLEDERVNVWGYQLTCLREQLEAKTRECDVLQENVE